NTKLLRVLSVQARPVELHRVPGDDASDRLSNQMPVEHVEANVPSGCTHRYEAPIDVVPQRESGTVTGRLQLPPHFIVTPSILEQLGRIGSRHATLRDHSVWNTDGR